MRARCQALEFVEGCKISMFVFPSVNKLVDDVSDCALFFLVLLCWEAFNQLHKNTCFPNNHKDCNLSNYEC